VSSFLALGFALAVAAGCAGNRPPVRPRPAPVPEPVRPAPPAQPAPTPPAPAPAPQPVPPPRQPALPEGPVRIRVGLASDLAIVTVPCCDGPVTVSSDGRQLAMIAPVRVEPAAGSAEAGFYRLQVAALRDENQSRGLAERLAAQTGQEADAHFDAGIDLYRVRLGRWATRPEAEEALRHLAALGVTGAWVVSEGAEVSQPALRVSQGKDSWVVPGRWVAFDGATSADTAGSDADSGLRVQGKRYRGRILVYLNDRGSLNLINELPVEQYLRGVVPSEMGPEQYRQVEALKAQTVAARTYALRNLGEFAREGYDICATPRCQVYNGMGVEHPLTDRAIAETAGQVLLYQGELVDALYSSTCGGHTENVQVIFPLKDEPYLKGVPCIETGMVRLDGDLPAGTPFPAGLTRRLLPPAAGGLTPETPGTPETPEIVAARLEHLALLAGLHPPHGRLASLERREVQRFVAAAFDLALDARLLLAPADIAYLLHDPPADWTAEDRTRAAYLVQSGLLDGPLDRPLDGGEVERLLLGLAEMLQVLRREEVTFLALARSEAGGTMTVKAGADDRTFALPARLATFRRGSAIAAGALGLLPGDALTVYWRGAEPAALVQAVDARGAAYDRSSKWSNWTRFRSDAQIAGQVQTRLPGLGFRTFEVLSRGVSGRVGKIRIAGATESAEVEGLAVRWTLDVPDTLFTVKRLEPPGQEPGWLFTGRGWGHGVGMCQVGAFGMAQRGHGYRDILTHYYSGVELGRVREAAAAQAAPAAP
jgi:stage II sporulation protein D